MQPETLSAEELRVLQELMNIAFGKASAALAARLGDRVVLSVPDVQVMPSVLLRYYVGAEFKDQPAVSVVEHAFRGELAGSAFLVLPAGAAETLLALAAPGEGAPAAERVRSALAEAGKTLLGTCVARLAELLGTTVTSSPPAVIVDSQRAGAIRPELFGSGDPAVVLQVAFDLHPANVHGRLFLASSPESIRWLRPALARFMAQFA
jgi:chemotaxis protein CheC